MYNAKDQQRYHSSEVAYKPEEKATEPRPRIDVMAISGEGGGFGFEGFGARSKEEEGSGGLSSVGRKL